MRTLEQQTKRAALLIFALGMACVLLATTGCGKQGPMGPTGAQGIQGATGPQGNTGPQGLPGSQGPQGIAGPSGPIGPQGQVGPAGQNGTIISFVQLCPNFVPTYPSIFPEYGECVTNANGSQTLYGVYSANGGFWAELPPGTYDSDGINASCTLTIGANCALN